MNKIKETLSILVLFSLLISISYFSYDEYKKRKNEKVFIDILSNECFDVAKNYEYGPITSASSMISVLSLPDNIKVRVIGKCANKIYESN